MNKYTWEQLEQECNSCKSKQCKLHIDRNNVVIGVGNTKANVMFIGEAPGEEEDQIGLPFQGKAGRLLNEALAEIGIDRKDMDKGNTNIYIANIIKCRPTDMTNKGRKNRTPEPKEIKACEKYIKAQIELIKPKVVVLLGITALNGILGKTLTIKDNRGIVYIPTYHPSFYPGVHKNPNELKEKLKEDIQKAINIAEKY